MENAEAKAVKNDTVIDKSDGEDCNEAREEKNRPGRSGEDDDVKQTCQIENKTISFNVQLLCVSDNSTTATSRTFTARKFPESVAALKLAIQEGFHVPVYDQKLSFDCTVMADGESLDFYRLRDGDQITLEYTTTVDIECALRLMSLLRNALEFVKNDHVQMTLASGKILSPVFSKMISDTLCVENINLSIHELVSTTEKVPRNSKFLLNNGGLDVITSLHSLLLRQAWDQICHLDLQLLEKHVTYLLFSLYAVIPHHLKYEVVNNLHNIFGSFLRVPISSSQITVIHNPNLLDTTRSQQFQVLMNVLINALQSLTQISGDEQHQVQIASNQKMMKQFIGCLKNPTVNTPVHRDVLCCLENLSYNLYTHKYLSNVDLIGALINVADMRPSHPIHFEDMDPALCSKLESHLVMYFGVMVISHLALNKAALLPEQLSSQVEFFLGRFLRNVDCNLLHEWMVKSRGFRWLDIFPTMRLVYRPLHYTSLCSIDLLCFEAGVLSLQIILSRDSEMQTLIKQGLLDYLICLPWHISEGLEAHKRAKLLLEMVRSHMPLQPPSLNNIVRAKLAATWCGLEEAMNLDCRQLMGICQETAARPYKGQIQMTI